MKWLKQIFCKHKWFIYPTKFGDKKFCTKCHKHDDVYMGWV